MRHFEQLDSDTTQELFAMPPEPLGGSASAAEIGTWLGATLYIPGARPTLIADLVRQRAAGALSVVVDFEDSVPDALADAAPALAARLIDELEAVEFPLPLVFLRMRCADDINNVVSRLCSPASHLAGFVFAKFDPRDSAEDYLDALDLASVRAGRTVVGMPILESPSFAYRESRSEQLEATRELLLRRPDGVACIRIGGTDLASAFGLRRTADTTVYDIKVVADVVADIVNCFVRGTPEGLAVSAPVWEHFWPNGRFLKPRLRETPFERHDASSVRESLVATGRDVLLSEINLDKLNGLVGKTVIHPSHVHLVHSLSVVSHEEYLDARLIVDQRDLGGVLRSPAGNKMNEVRPHFAWATRVLHRARVFGVARPSVDFVDLLVASGGGQS